MKPFSLLGLAALALAACAPTQPLSGPPAPAPPPVPSAPAAAAVREAPRNWQLLDVATDGVPGIGAERAYGILAGRQPKRTVVVAVIDSGVDTAHVDLRANLWTNPREIAGNGRDDDGNGYVDDVRGWNFIGGADGRGVRYDTYEVTRQYVRCTRAPQPAAQRATQGPALSAAERQRCPEIERDFARQRTEAEQTLQQVRAIGEALARATPILREALGTDSVSPERVMALQSPRTDVQQARGVYLQLAENGVTPAVVEEARTEFEARLQYRLNPDYDPRPLVGDNAANLSERRYGNRDVMGPDAEHGTHVAGIIGAVRGNDVGIDGIAPAVRIMSVRTVPDGDERDKDVANAIRYAVDNGAHIINMSFGKAYSPQKSVVDEAVKYADGRGVLLVHAAGNDGADLGRKPSYPTPNYQNGGRAQNWIEVGASSWGVADSLAAPFSNYGQGHVDVFAPGVDILSTVPGDEYERNSGTSMAAPVVSGLAALLMAYYPDLSATDVKRIILESASRRAEQRVVRPGSTTGETVPFGSLSGTGGVVNAEAALRIADQMSAARP